MIYDISGTGKQDTEVEDRLRLMKGEYNSRKMAAAQVEELKRRITEVDTGHRGRWTWTVKFAVAAALAAGFIALPNTSATAARTMGQIPVIGRLVKVVTFRDYSYESDRNMADVKIPEIEANGGELQRTAEEVNAEIKGITDRLIKEFKENLDKNGGYQDITVDSEVLAKTGGYFTLKLNCYQAAGSGYESHYYYTVDLDTGRRLQLKDLFVGGADYVAPISREIKRQMKGRMKADENAIYWLDSDIGEWNFKKIKKDAQFYLNGEGNVVICFNEGDVAPMYMGAVEFEIPDGVLYGIRK